VCVLAVCALAVAAAGPPAAISAGPEGGSSFSELSEKAQQQSTATQTTATATTTNEPTSNSKKTILIAIVAAIALLLAIAFVIVRDARRVAPAGDPEAAEVTSAHDAAARLHKRRAKAKAARQQRKRNR
jgi:beta-lactamase regulating signal transducer with metallopeptidase domain